MGGNLQKRQEKDIFTEEEGKNKFTEMSTEAC